MVTEAGTTDVDAVRTAMYGQEYPNLTGGTAVMLANHHLSKPVLIEKSWKMVCSTSSAKLKKFQGMRGQITLHLPALPTGRN